MRIFAERELSEYLASRLDSLRSEIQAEDKNRLLNVNETEYVAYLVERYKIVPLVLHWENVRVSDREELIPAERFPHNFNVYSGKRYPKQIITYHLPVTGDLELLKCTPSTRMLWTMDVKLGGGSISFDIINWRDDANEIKGEAERNLNDIKQQAGHLEREVTQFNGALDNETRRVVKTRKDILLKQANLIASLGVPFHRADQVPATFAVPIVPKKVVIKPSASTAPFSPEPVLDDTIYQDILRIMHEAGVEMERHPAIYGGKDEETLRDHFIMVLSPNFQSVTGETFNRNGKTDILIRHEKSNVFVAECKFWKGIKAFFDTIDQVLSYLTWRDSKASIMCFIQNKELQPVLQQIESKTLEHSCFIKYHGKRAESWFKFEFHLKDDHTRSVHLAVLCFHFP